MSDSSLACYIIGYTRRSLLPGCAMRYSFFFFFNDTATTEIYTLSLHDALPISAPPPSRRRATGSRRPGRGVGVEVGGAAIRGDRKSTRLNSSHLVISYAVFCLKKKKKKLVVLFTGR